MKKIAFGFTFVLLMMALLCFGANALEETGQCGENVFWNFNESTGELVISGEGEMYDYDYSELPFRLKESIKSVVIENGVTNIPDQFFYCCTEITDVVIGESVSDVGMYAFSQCIKLTDVKIGNGVKRIGEWAFYYCINLENITFGAGLEEIGQYAFAEVEKIEALKIPEGTKVIENAAFHLCTGLKEITIPKSVTTIFPMAFFQCDNLTDVYYNGTHQEWKQITIYVLNDPLHCAEFHSSDGKIHNKIVYKAVEATCTKPGNTLGIYCYECEDWIAEKQILTKEHSELTETIEATCTEKGQIITSCSICGQMLNTENIPANGHKYNSWIVNYPTCSAEGEERSFCTVCDEEKIEKLEKLPHMWEEWNVLQEPDLMNTGEKIRYCSNCTANEKEKLSVLEGTVIEDAHSGVKIEYTEEAYNGDNVELVVKEDAAEKDYSELFYTNVVAWNIKTQINGVDVQPNKPVLVTITLPEYFDMESISISRVSNNCQYSIWPLIIEDNSLIFLAETLDVYSIVDRSSAIEEVQEDEEPAGFFERIREWFESLFDKIKDFFESLF